MLRGCVGSVKVSSAAAGLVVSGRYRAMQAASRRTVRLRVGGVARRRFKRRAPKRVTGRVTNSRAPAGLARSATRIARLH